MTYNVFGGTLNLTQPTNETWHQYSSREWELLKRFSLSKVKVMVMVVACISTVRFRGLRVL